MAERITEDYVSFETAKLLRDKGFNERCQKVYMYNGQLLWAPIFMEGESFVNNEDIDLVANYNDWDTHTQGEYAYLCPTLQMAMKWFRKVHNMQIQIAPFTPKHKNWAFGIYKEFSPLTTDLLFYPTYEEACDASIKYCLEKLSWLWA